MRIIIAGTRTFDDYALLKRKMDAITRKAKTVIVISGGEQGADKLGERWAYECGHSYEVYHADWNLGKRAGPIRNSQMLDEGQADAAVVFWDGKSPGTRDLLLKARALGLPVRVINYTKE
jgi:hypothetical protein